MIPPTYPSLNRVPAASVDARFSALLHGRLSQQCKDMFHMWLIHKLDTYIIYIYIYIYIENTQPNYSDHFPVTDTKPPVLTNTRRLKRGMKCSHISTWRGFQRSLHFGVFKPGKLYNVRPPSDVNVALDSPQ